MLEQHQIILLSLIPVLWILSGLCRAAVHTILHHFQAFDEKFNVDDQWFDPKISHTNKKSVFWTIKLFGKIITKFKIPVQASDAFHFFNTLEIIFDSLREGIYISILASLLFALSFWVTMLILFGGLIISGTFKILIAFNLGYDRIWR